MSWGPYKRKQIWKRQNGLCQICGKTLSLKKCVIHHYKNRSQGGHDSIANGRARHSKCEELAHKLHYFGNPTYINTSSKIYRIRGG